MTIEVLYPELACLYGDQSNIKYLSQCVPQARIHRTHNLETPLFVTEKIDMLYIGAMPESKQELAIQRLMPHRDKLWQLIEEGLVVLATSNALELFGKEIQDGSRTIEALGFFPITSRRDMENRHNSMFWGKFEDMEIVGNKSQFTFSYGRFDHPFVQVLGGYGMNMEEKYEGIHYKNFFGTYLLGPFLVLNPPFTRHFLKLLGYEGELAFEQQAMEAYTYRLNALKRPGVKFLMGEHG